ncbi:unnamed protein product [Darwinula stevensoni]|uniref:Major facilitator superfamily domain-containing protein 12-like n=1 Tax=Darwinula stevensoni TaxID=69355 RepID=A0A7R8X8Z5_9CRUS|nr:unnamed protein product [Darwinula stevensoni]CAG0885045.1 unnamed protein product [Darwinula stevensoni]
MGDDVTIVSPSTLSWRVKLAYGIGHVLNDLCASMWFTYLLLYFHFVLKFNNAYSGIILLIGQIADAVSTPFIGIESDRVDDFWFCKYGRRKTWHLVGTICVLGTFPFIFMPCVQCENAHQGAQMVYYAAFVIIFQFGWAAVQVAHLALIPDLTPDEHERTELNAIRYAFTVLSNISVYTITWVVLGLQQDNPGTQKIGPEDTTSFQSIVLITVSVGALFSVLFHMGVKESSPQPYTTLDGGETRKMKVMDWLRIFPLYQVAALYMLARLFVNVTQVYIPLYLQDSLELKEESIAVIPLVMFIIGFLSSFGMKKLNQMAGRKITYALGAALGIGACIWVQLGSESTLFRTYEVYAVAALLGVSMTTVLITSLSITTDLIGQNIESGAFVYGAMSFCDKLANGVAVLLIQVVHPCRDVCPGCGGYYRDIISYFSGSTLILSLVVVATIIPTTFHRPRSGGLPLVVVSSP